MKSVVNNKKLIEINNVSKAFNNRTIISNINFHVNSGESLVIIGKSGAGKSILLKCIIGLIYPDSGYIKINNIMLNYHNQNKIIKDIGVLFQQPALFDSMTIWENITLGLNLIHNKALDLAACMLNEVNLSNNILYQMPNTLSGGMQKRVALARAMAKKPKIIIFDEPTTGLDPITGDSIIRLILQTINRTQVTAISVTHDIRYMFSVANRVIMLNDSQIVWNDDVRQVMQTSNQYIKKFIPPECILHAK